MAVERTLSIIKPDAVAKNVIGQIYTRFEDAGLQVVASRMLRLSEDLAGGFYAEHRERPFFPALIEFMTSRGGAGAGRRQRHRQESRVDGCDQSEGRRPRHHSCGLRGVHRCQRRPRLRLAGFR